MNDDNPAKALYWSYACNHFYLDRDGAREEYRQLGGGDAAVENKWRLEFIEDCIKQLPTDDINILHNLQTAEANEAIPDLLNLENYGDDYSKFWFAFTLAEVASGRMIIRPKSWRAVNRARKLWKEILNTPQGISDTHLGEFNPSMLEGLNASTPAEYLINYSKDKLKSTKWITIIIWNVNWSPSR